MTEKECIAETQKHIDKVSLLTSSLASLITSRGITHDASKLIQPELAVFTEFTPKLKGTTYGSSEYKEYLRGMQAGLDHHYSNNRHHPEYWGMWICPTCNKRTDSPMHSDGHTCGTPPEHYPLCPSCGVTEEHRIGTLLKNAPTLDNMNLIDIVEMACDWKAASLRHADGDYKKSVIANQKRFNFDDTMKSVLLNMEPIFEKILKGPNER